MQARSKVPPGEAALVNLKEQFMEKRDLVHPGRRAHIMGRIQSQDPHSGV
jgi:hypothetical protein